MFPFFLYELAVLSKGVIFRARAHAGMTSKVGDSNGSSTDNRSTLLCIILPYILLHSFSEHKEFRFLLPILPLICVLAGHSIAELVAFMDDASVISSEKKRSLTFTKLLIVALILLNYPHLIYLGMVHQRGPIAVNQYLSTIISEETGDNGRCFLSSQHRYDRHYTIHYLMGCHSAPLYSHLHIPGVRVNAWHLDCSPDCRSSPHALCQSNAFLRNPLGFVTSTYAHVDDSFDGDGSCNNGANEDCPSNYSSTSARELPHFLVVMEDDALKIADTLINTHGMSHLRSIRHAIKSLSWHSSVSSCHDAFTLFSLIDVCFDHIEVYRHGK